MSKWNEPERERLKEKDKLIFDELAQKVREEAIKLGTAIGEIIPNTRDRTDITNDRPDQPDRWSKLQAESDRRLALLRRQNIIRFSQGIRCLLCGAKPKLVANPGMDHDNDYEDSHRDGCELAEELK